MTAAALLADLQVRGVRLYLAGGELRYQAKPGIMTPELAAAVQPIKPALIALLQEEEAAAIAWRVEAMRGQILAGAPVPFLVALPEIEAAPDRCLSCGEPMEMLGYVPRCRLCAVAVARLLDPHRRATAQPSAP